MPGDEGARVQTIHVQAHDASRARDIDIAAVNGEIAGIDGRHENFRRLAASLRDAIERRRRRSRARQEVGVGRVEGEAVGAIHVRCEGHSTGAGLVDSIERAVGIPDDPAVDPNTLVASSAISNGVTSVPLSTVGTPPPVLLLLLLADALALEALVDEDPEDDADAVDVGPLELAVVFEVFEVVVELVTLADAEVEPPAPPVSSPYLPKSYPAASAHPPANTRPAVAIEVRYRDAIKSSPEMQRRLRQER